MLRPFAALLLCGVAEGLISGLARPVSTPLRLRHAVRLCAPDAGPPEAPLLAGRPLLEGDLLLHKDEESTAWWRCVATNVATDSVLIHYAGCDDSWDVWVPIDEINLCRMDVDEKAKERGGAFQSEQFEASLDDEELLAEMRKKRWEDNARWQANVFARAQLGQYAGIATEYVPNVRPDGAIRFATSESSCSNKALVPDDAPTTVEITDGDLATSAMALDLTVDYTHFTPEKGNMAVGNAYTFVSGGEGEGGLMVELALKEGTSRVRCKLLYSPGSDGERKLERLAVLREACGEGSFAEGLSKSVNDLDGAPGRGLYDSPLGAHDGAAYTTLYCDGGITLKFPREAPLDQGGYISLDWIAGEMRYQLDRKWARLDGSLASLELTEISKADAESYPPRNT